MVKLQVRTVCFAIQGVVVGVDDWLMSAARPLLQVLKHFNRTSFTEPWIIPLTSTIMSK